MNLNNDQLAQCRAEFEEWYKKSQIYSEFCKEFGQGDKALQAMAYIAAWRPRLAVDVSRAEADSAYVIFMDVIDPNKSNGTMRDGVVAVLKYIHRAIGGKDE